MNNDPTAAFQLPVTYWASIHFFQPENNSKVGVVTKGIAPFLGFEIEVSSCDLTPAKISEHAFNTAAYIVCSGAALKDNENITTNYGSKFTVKNITASNNYPAFLRLSHNNE